MTKIKILDLSTLLPGPFATHVLAKYISCEILKFEDVRLGDPLADMAPTKDGIGLAYSKINAGKKIIKVDFRSDGLTKILQEAKTAQVVIENFKPGKAERLGLGFDDFKKISPKIIYCSVTGYPQSHPLADAGAHDANILALSGYLEAEFHATNTTSLPPIQIADMFTAYSVSMQILAALYTGQGGHLRVSMLESMQDAMITIDKSSQDYLLSGKLPCYGIYEGKDGMVVVAALEKSLWTDLCSVLGREDLVPRQFDPDTRSEIETEMKKYTKEFWIKEQPNLCVTPVYGKNT